MMAMGIMIKMEVMVIDELTVEMDTLRLKVSKL
jgi:hypothetical protein